MTEEELLLHRARESLLASRVMIREGYPNIAASRSYYAMFFVAEALLLSKNLAFSSHSAVIAAYGKEFARTRLLDPKFHRYLIASQDARQIGNYSVEKNITIDEANQIVDWAEEFIKAAKTYLGQENSTE